MCRITVFVMQVQQSAKEQTVSREYEDLDSGTLYQHELRLREEYRQVKYGDEGEQRNHEIERELKTIQNEWSRRSD